MILREEVGILKRAMRVTLNPTNKQQIILGCLMYASRKLWNVANYERRQWNKDSEQPYPNWYDQKKRLKDHFWYKNLPSQTAQEVLKVLDQSWKSFYQLVKSGGIENPKPPRFKQKNFNIKFLNNGFTILSCNQLRLSLSKRLKGYLKEKYGIEDRYLDVHVPNHVPLDQKIKTIEIRPLSNGKFDLILVVETEDVKVKSPSEKFMSIDMGVNNFLSCYLYNGKSIILSGRQMLSINRYFDKTIAHYESISKAQQAARGMRYPKSSKRVLQLFEKRQKQVHHLLHSMTRQIVNIAKEYGVETIVIGNITGIREGKKMGRVNNQKFHRLPFAKVIQQITYKAEEVGICMKNDITEEYTSQTCACCKERPSKENARKTNRKHRGLYVCQECSSVINADINGAINLSKKYLETLQREPVVVLDTPKVYTFNGHQFVA